MKQALDPAGLFTPGTSTVAAWCGFLPLALLYGPIVGLVILSFSAQPLSGIPWPLSLRWYQSLLATDNLGWLNPLLTSVAVGLVVAILSTISAVLVGRQIAILRKPTGMLAAYFSVLIVPGILVGIAVLLFYRVLLGIPTGIWSVILVHYIWALPFALLCILIVSFRFDRRLLEAAEDLGATRFRRFVDIEIPLLMPGISASLFFSFLLSFNELPRTLYARGSTVTLPYYVWTASASHSPQASLIYALSSLIVLVSSGLTILAMRLLSRN